MKKLSARQIDWMQSVGRDKLAAQRVFMQAMDYYSNRLVEIEKQREEFWKDLCTVFELDPDKKYKTVKLENEVCVVEVEQEDEK